MDIKEFVMKIRKAISERSKKVKDAVDQKVFLPVVIGMGLFLMPLLNGSGDLYDSILGEVARFIDQFLLPLLGLLIAAGGFYAMYRIIKAGQKRFADHAEHPAGPQGGDLKSFWGIALSYFIFAIAVALLSGFGGAILIKWGLFDHAAGNLLQQFVGPYT